MIKDLIVKTLVIEVDREDHIAKHGVKIDEVIKIVSGDYVYIKGKLERWLLIGRTKEERYLTVVIGERDRKGTYGLVTARPSRKEEKSFYKELTLGGDKDD